MDIDMAPPPTINGTIDMRNVLRMPPPSVVLIITNDGRWMRGDKELKDLPSDELIRVIHELVDLIRKR